MRFNALTAMTRGYRPSISVSEVAKQLGFERESEMIGPASLEPDEEEVQAAATSACSKFLQVRRCCKEGRDQPPRAQHPLMSEPRAAGQVLTFDGGEHDAPSRLANFPVLAPCQTDERRCYAMVHHDTRWTVRSPVGSLP